MLYIEICFQSEVGRWWDWNRCRSRNCPKPLLSSSTRPRFQFPLLVFHSNFNFSFWCVLSRSLLVAKFAMSASSTTWLPNLQDMQRLPSLSSWNQIKEYWVCNLNHLAKLKSEIILVERSTQVTDSILWVRCASGNVLLSGGTFWSWVREKILLDLVYMHPGGVRTAMALFFSTKCLLRNTLTST